MIESVKIEKDMAKRLSKALGGASKRLPQEIKIVLNKTAKSIVSSTKEPKGMSQRIGEHLNMPAGKIKEKIKVKLKATKDNATAIVEMGRTKRPTLKSFKGTTWTKKNGVGYRIDKRQKRERRPSGFTIEKRGNQFFERQTPARTGSIAILRGISPMYFYLKNNMHANQARDNQIYLKKQMEKRIKYLLLKKTGAI